ncbi:MFS transporter [Amycolatopsis thailandensis]|nr:MFS transporter [Amycolatopsis thailandensis]
MMKERIAVFAIFVLSGVLSGSWTPRLPSLAEQVRAGPGAIGLALLAMTLGMLIVAPLAGRLAERLGARAMVVVSTVLSCGLLPFLGLADSVLGLGWVLLGLGASVGAMEVSMSISGVAAERRAARPIMMFFHAGFSIGGLAGSALAGIAAAVGWSPVRHFTVVAVVVAIVLFAMIRGLSGTVAYAATREMSREHLVSRGTLLRRPALWLLGTIGLLAAIAEGACADWSAMLLVVERGAREEKAALGYAVFSLAMVITRLSLLLVQRRLGAKWPLVAGSLMAGCGLVVAAAVPVTGLTFAGFAVAGIGLASSFPLVQTLAGAMGRRHDGGGGEREIAFVSTIAYAGFLAGPPMIGVLAQLASLSLAFVVVGALTASAAFVVLGVDRARHREIAAGFLQDESAGSQPAGTVIEQG